VSSKVRYTSRANADIDEIAEFTFQRWGDKQAEAYVDDLYGTCRLIGESPEIGRRSASRSGWRRLEHESHVILYSLDESGVLIQRVMHRRQLLSRANR
jgi:toxin ParE1/3/4